MITINSERGFVDVETWDEVLEQPGFTSNLDPRQEQLKEIIGRYVFQEKIPCGLSTCRQPHARGFIVTTESGKVTNLGRICGRSHFGVLFDEYSKAFHQALTDHTNRETISAFLSRIERCKGDVAELRNGPRGADRVYQAVMTFHQHNRGCPEEVLDKIQDMVRTRNNTIRVAREATEEEVQAIEAASGQSVPRPHYVEDEVGRLAGLPVLFPENDLRKILVLDIEVSLKDLDNLDVANATSNDLRRWGKWCGEFDQKLDRAREVTLLGQRFLTQENLAQLSVLIDEQDQRWFLEWIQKMIPAAEKQPAS